MQSACECHPRAETPPPAACLSKNVPADTVRSANNPRPAVRAPARQRTKTQSLSQVPCESEYSVGSDSPKRASPSLSQSAQKSYARGQSGCESAPAMHPHKSTSTSSVAGTPAPAAELRDPQPALPTHPPPSKSFFLSRISTASAGPAC